MYKLFKSNEQDESLLLLKERIPSEREAMELLKECKEPHCQIEEYDGDYHLITTKHKNKITTYYNTQLSGSLINVDEVRESFMNTVCSVLSDDSTNNRANDIINAFDSLPTTKYGITAQVLKDCADLINSTCYEEGTGISDDDIEYTIKVRGLK